MYLSPYNPICCALYQILFKSKLCRARLNSTHSHYPLWYSSRSLVIGHLPSICVSQNINPSANLKCMNFHEKYCWVLNLQILGCYRYLCIKFNAIKYLQLIMHWEHFIYLNLYYIFLLFCMFIHYNLLLCINFYYVPCLVHRFCYDWYWLFKLMYLYQNCKLHKNHMFNFMRFYQRVCKLRLSDKYLCERSEMKAFQVKDL